MTKKALSCLLLLSVFMLGPAACKKKPAPVEAEKEWYRYISAFTSGTVFRKSAVRVLFVPSVGAEGRTTAGLLEFSPAIDGAAEWKSPRELVFTPRAS
jgi:hypothetical protein